MKESYSFIRKTISKTANTRADTRAENQGWRGTIVEMMEAYGFRPIGSGQYGEVFEKPNYPYVIKVFMRDTAYLRWLNFCLGHQRNKHIPKIRGRVVKIGLSLMAIRLEKLIDQITDEVHDLRDLCLDPEDALEYRMDNMSLTSDQLEICTELAKNHQIRDIHYGNIMVRPGTGDAVLVDAYYNYYRGGKYTLDPDDLTDLKHLF